MTCIAYRLVLNTCRWALCLVSMLALSAACTQELSYAEQWSMDIDVLHQELERRHINLYHRISRAELTEQLNEIKRQLPDLTRTQIMVALMRTIKQVGDGHTQFNYWGAPHHRYPLRLRLFENDIRVIGVGRENRDLLGMRLHDIDGVLARDVVQRLKPVLQGVENAYSERHQITATLPVVEVLQGLGITEGQGGAEFLFIDDKGEKHRRLLTGLPADKAAEALIVTLEPELPAGFSRSDRSIDGVTLRLNKELSTAYIRFDHYPSQRRMESFARGLGKAFSEHDIRRLIIDLRYNGGGDFFVGLTLAWGLILIDDLDWRSGIYVLTGPQTFSAAMTNSVQYRQILNARLVGEPTGANPVGYQDADTFQLPHSGWTVMYSKRFYRFQEKDTEGVQPDVIIPPKWLQHRVGIDNQLQWVLKDLKGSPSQ